MERITEVSSQSVLEQPNVKKSFMGRLSTKLSFMQPSNSTENLTQLQSKDLSQSVMLSSNSFERSKTGYASGRMSGNLTQKVKESKDIRQ